MALRNSASVAGHDLVVRAEKNRRPFDPELVLFVDDSEESRAARSLLELTGKPFRVLTARGANVPAAVFGGILGERLEGVENIVHALDAFEATLLTTARERVPHIFPKKPSHSNNGTRAHKL